MSLKEMQEGKLGTYIPLFFFRYRGQDRETARKDMTKEQKVELCKIYNDSDIDSFKYMMQFCDNEQKELLKRLIELNTQTTIGRGDKSCTEGEQDEYYDGKWKLLNSFGIENVGGDAYFEGEFYQ